MLFARERGGDAVVLLETGPNSHSYPYCVRCRREADGSWVEVSGSNSPGWSATGDDRGVVTCWGSAASPSAPVVVTYAGSTSTAARQEGYFFEVFWDVADPAEPGGPAWPEVTGAVGGG